jgi:hypothetical protein
MVLERLHVAGLLAVEVFGRLDRQPQPQDGLELLDRLGIGVVDDKRPEPLLEEVRILASGQMQPGI